MNVLQPSSAAAPFVRSTEVASDTARQRPQARTGLPQAMRGSPEYISDATAFVTFIRSQLAINPGVALASLEIYGAELARDANDGPLAKQREVLSASNPLSVYFAGRIGAAEQASKSPPSADANAAARIARFRAALEPLLTGGDLPARPNLAASDVASIYAAARSASIPLGRIRCREQSSDDAALTYLVEKVQPQTLGFTGGDLLVKAPTEGTSTARVAAYVAATTTGGKALELKLSKRLVAFVRDKLASAGLFPVDQSDTEAILRAFGSGNRGSVVAAFRQLILASPDLIPRLQRVLRNYDGDALNPGGSSLTDLQKVTRVMSLLFGSDVGLRKVEVAAMTADLVSRSQRVTELIDAHPDEAVWDVAIVGMGAHGRAAADRIMQTNPEIRVLGNDRAPQSYNFGRGGGAYFMNSRQGKDDGRPGGNGRGNINPVAGTFLVSDASGTAYPVARDVDDVGVIALHETAERSNLDLALDSEVVKIEHRDRTRAADALTWKAPFRLTYASGRVTYAHKCMVANGFGSTPKEFGDTASNGRFQAAVTDGQAKIAAWRARLAESIVNGTSSKPSFDADVMTVADAMAVADTDGCDALAPFRARTPFALEANGAASCTFVGYGDSSRTAIELALGLAPDEAYRNTPAQLGQLTNLVWIVGGGPATCFEFLVGRDHLKKVLSKQAYDVFTSVMNGKAIEDLFGDSRMMDEIREKLAPVDQAALDGARTRYQRISGAILKGTLRLESCLASSFDQVTASGVQITLDDGRKLLTGKLIDGRGYEAELGPVAWLTDPENPNPKKRISDTTNLTRVRAPVPEGVIGRGGDGEADVAKSVAGLEDDFAWAGPGNGGDVVSKKLIEATTKVGANTVSLFANQPLTLAATDKLAAGATRVGRSLSEIYPEELPRMERGEAPTRVGVLMPYASLVPVEARADSWLETHARLASLLQGYDVSAFSPNATVNLTLRRAGESARMRGVTLELSSDQIAKPTLDRIAKQLTADGRFAALVLQSLQDPEVALSVSGVVRDTTRGLQLDVPTSRLVTRDAEELDGTAIIELGRAADLKDALASARNGTEDTARLGTAILASGVADGSLTQAEVDAARAEAINQRPLRRLDAVREGYTELATGEIMSDAIAKGLLSQAQLDDALRVGEDVRSRLALTRAGGGRVLEDDSRRRIETTDEDLKRGVSRGLYSEDDVSKARLSRPLGKMLSFTDGDVTSGSSRETLARYRNLLKESLPKRSSVIDVGVGAGGIAAAALGVDSDRLGVASFNTTNLFVDEKDGLTLSERVRAAIRNIR